MCKYLGYRFDRSYTFVDFFEHKKDTKEEKTLIE